MAKYFYILQCSSSKHIRDSRVFYSPNFKQLINFFKVFSDNSIFSYWRLQVFDRKTGCFIPSLTIKLTSKLSVIRKSLSCRFKY